MVFSDRNHLPDPSNSPHSGNREVAYLTKFWSWWWLCLTWYDVLMVILADFRDLGGSPSCCWSPCRRLWRSSALMASLPSLRHLVSERKELQLLPRLKNNRRSPLSNNSDPRFDNRYVFVAMFHFRFECCWHEPVGLQSRCKSTSSTLVRHVFDCRAAWQ